MPRAGGNGTTPVAKINNIAPALAGMIVDVSRLNFDPQNARIHPQRNIQEIQDSLRWFGQRKPIVVRKEGMIVVAGNGLLEAAKRLGWTRIAATVQEMTDAEAAGYGLADNRVAESSVWDAEVVARLQKLHEATGDCRVGWSDEDLLTLRAAEWNNPPQDGDGELIPQSPKQLVVELGDVWLLGAHRLVCGDSRDTECLLTALNGNKATVLFTDPPYGVAIGKKNRFLNSFQKSGRRLEDIRDDQLSPKDLKESLLAAFVNAVSHLADDCSIFVCSPQGSELCMMMMMMLQEAGLPPRHVLIWKKQSATFSMNRLDYDYQHEPILFGWKKTHKRTGDGFFRTSVWEVDRPTASPDHATTKPLKLPLNAILRHSDPGDLILDIYAGTGTTIIAAQQTGRIAVGLDIDPRCVEVSLQRFLDTFHIDPIREIDGASFSDLRRDTASE